MLFHRKKQHTHELSPDEIFLDSANIPGFERERMEGRLELPLARSSVFAFFAALVGIIAVFSVQLFRLQIIEGREFAARASLNRLETHTILPARGLILDQRGEKLAWNDPSFQLVLNNKAIHKDIDAETLKKIFSLLEIETNDKKISESLAEIAGTSKDVILAESLSWEETEMIRKNFPEIPFRVEAATIRRYTESAGFAHILGYLGYSDKDTSLFSFANIKSGKSGVELAFNDKLAGRAGERAVEVDSKGRIVTQATQEDQKDGEAIELTIDAGLQAQLARSIGRVVSERGFRGGAGVAIDLKSGGALAITSFPEFDSNSLSSGISQAEFEKISLNPANPFFFRALDGLYQPGSAIKPLIALAALSEGVISPETEIYSSGSISVPNPYFPDKPSVFHDWKAHGWVDMRRALAVSSNVYFYAIGGGYEDIAGLGVSKIEEYLRLFGFEDKVDFFISNAKNAVLGLEWKKRNQSADPVWRIGDTYNLSIGQSILATPLAIARLAQAIALDGKILKLKILRENQEVPEFEMMIDIPENYFRIVKEGMRRAVLEGTAQALSGLGVNVAGKTGTAEIGNGRVHSWFMGFLPYENPKIALVVVLESGDAHNLVGAPAASREVVEWITLNRPEWLVDNSIDIKR